MANSFNAPKIFQDSFVAAIAEQTSAFVRAGRVVVGPAGTYSIGGIMAGGIAQTVADTDSSVTATDIATAIASASTSKRVIKHTVPRHVMEKDFAMKAWAEQLASDCLVNMDKDYFDFLEGLFAASHPRAGAGVT